MHQPTLESAQATLLHRLETAEKPLSKSKLLSSQGKVWLEAFQTLVKSKRIVDLGSSGKSKTAFVFVPKGEELDFTRMAEKSILDHEPPKPIPMLLRKLKELAGYKKVKDKVVEAAGKLVDKKKGIMFKCGAGTYFLHLAPIEVLFKPSEPGLVSILEEKSNHGEILISTYRKLVQETGYRDITIAALIRESALSISTVQAWIKTECLAHRANPSKGEPTLATLEERDAALKMEGETFYLVRLIP